MKIELPARKPGRFARLKSLVSCFDCVHAYPGDAETSRDVTLNRPTLAVYCGREFGVKLAGEVLSEIPTGLVTFRFRTLADAIRWQQRVLCFAYSHAFRRENRDRNLNVWCWMGAMGNLPYSTPKPPKLDPATALEDESLRD